MTTETLNLTDDLREYILSVSLREHPVLRCLRKENETHLFSRFQIAPEQGQLMGLLARLIRAKRGIEVGAFTGYSSIATALAMPHDATLVVCDNSEEYTNVALRYWKQAGVAHKIDLRLGLAVDTLHDILVSGEQDTYDFAFIDADKENYKTYYKHLFRLVRPGGIIAVDNTLWSGKVINPQADDPDTEAIRAFNKMLYYDNRIELSIIPIGDGLTIAMKR